MRGLCLCRCRLHRVRPPHPLAEKGLVHRDWRAIRYLDKAAGRNGQVGRALPGSAGVSVHQVPFHLHPGRFGRSDVRVHGWPARRFLCDLSVPNDRRQYLARHHKVSRLRHVGKNGRTGGPLCHSPLVLGIRGVGVSEQKGHDPIQHGGQSKNQVARESHFRRRRGPSRRGLPPAERDPPPGQLHRGREQQAESGGGHRTRHRRAGSEHDQGEDQAAHGREGGGKDQGLGTERGGRAPDRGEAAGRGDDVLVSEGGAGAGGGEGTVESDHRGGVGVPEQQAIERGEHAEGHDRGARQALAEGRAVATMHCTSVMYLSDL
mmetsp:Transcript_55746/g.118585  ORF Transcript_55746/g.118585 Transcript_55746/m.118585 type:complete len:319 (+) Transcript_55746:243-1199(+)